MSKLAKDLTTAFSGESQANMKYLFFAKKAEYEGHKQIAKLFRAAAEAEGIHAQNHLRAMGIIKSTKDNLQVALHEAVYKFENMYPPMIDDAKAEGDKWATKSFYYANEAEKVHAYLFTKALENFGTNLEVDYYVCRVCGFTVENEVLEKCPVCGSRKKVFKKIV